MPGGPSANPGGRPRIASEFREILEAELRQVVDDGDHTRMDALIRTLVDDAIDGNCHAQEFILDRIAPATAFVEQTNRRGMTAPEALGVLEVIRNQYVRTGEWPNVCDDD